MEEEFISVPSGNASKRIVGLLNYWLDQFIKDTPASHIAIKVFMVLPNLILQKPSKTSKVKHHIELMSRRMDNLETGNIEEIVRECNSIQHKLLKKQQTSKLFVRYMLFGKINSAVRLLENGGCQGVLPMNNENLELLKSKHPVGELAFKGSII